ncbi:MAG: hypothetical protein KUA35_05500 [Pseudodesulfovibrio sp.]|uniref:hypothetical protein n=1 Tax=Pseudodesulfovibrio TaxID=2035811 RepID=UPI0012FED8CE|nr:MULTISPECIES: hypothetical protein [Pseudodesulfovibrio]MBU4244504.1 hypothetical protein [Pseudomonadota bacterium]MBU4378391.1 hypothetical protein [Pseudomonadota bacterium]MBU4474881.1 hypothetical protein [Pseudomonadota bacterium]MBU4522739.1 hypothetical protein [Pseudomonadota bacterium]MBU4558887.1 hypothetical protein [Pseudomonadota bacterium]
MTKSKVLFPLLLLVFIAATTPVPAQKNSFVEGLIKAAEQGDVDARFCLRFRMIQSESDSRCLPDES